MATTAAAYMVDQPIQGEPASSSPQPQPVIPRWRGFNLVELMGGDRRKRYQETDFQRMAQWGFNFARLPCSYWTWSNKNNWMIIDESALHSLDEAVDLGRSYNIHINICLHRIPGYCVNGRELEPYQLFDSSHDSMERALEAAVHHWRYLAERYKDATGSQLSFDLINEPPFMPDQSLAGTISRRMIAAIRGASTVTDQSRYVEIARALITAIREVNPERLIFADGADIGQTPVMGLADQGIVQSTRGYLPKMLSHYGATWVSADEFDFALRANLAHDRQSRHRMESREASGRAHLQVAAASETWRANSRRRMGLL